MKFKKKMICFMLITTICVNNVQVANANPFIGTLPEIVGTVGSIASPEIALVFLMVAGFGIATNVICPDDPKKLGDDVRALGKKTEECILKSLDNMDKENHKEISNREENKKAIDSFLAKMCEGTIQTSSKGFKLIKYYVDSLLNPEKVSFFDRIDTNNFPIISSDMTLLALDNATYFNSNNKEELFKNGSYQYYNMSSVKKVVVDVSGASNLSKYGLSLTMCLVSSMGSTISPCFALLDKKSNSIYALSDGYAYHEQMLYDFLNKRGLWTKEFLNELYNLKFNLLYLDSDNELFGIYSKNSMRVLWLDSGSTIDSIFNSKTSGYSLLTPSYIMRYYDGILNFPTIDTWSVDNISNTSIDITDSPDIPDEYDITKAKDTDLTKAKEEDLTQDISIPTDITDESLPTDIPLWNAADSSIVLDYPDVINPDPSNPDPNDPDNPDKNELDKPDKDLAPYSFDLRNLFPFCLPFDLYKFIKLFQAEPKAPKFTWKFPTMGKKGVIQYTDLTIDLKQFDSVAKLVRGLFDIIFILGLIFTTRKTFLRG